MTSKEKCDIITAALEEKKAMDIRVLNISALTVIADYFVIANGSNKHQVQAMADEVQKMMYEAGCPETQSEGYQTANWILQDYDDVLVHLFDGENRMYYNLERIWKDAKIEK